MLRLCWAMAILSLATASTLGQSDDSLQPKTARLTDSSLTLRQALDQLRVQTGNRVRDLRSTPADVPVKLKTTEGHFWPLLDEIAQASGIGLTTYGPDGSIALVDAAYRPLPVTYSGLFRITCKRVATSVDFETKAHLLHGSLDVAWEPRFQPFYLDLRALTATYPDGKQVTNNEHGAVMVAGRSATELDVRLPAPSREATRIERLSGRLTVIGPIKMLDFRFSKLEPIRTKDEARQATEDGVTVRLTRLMAGRDRWSVDVQIENPPGGPVFESYQSWLDNNRIELVRKDEGKELVWTPAPSEEQQLGQLTARQAHIRYHFPIESGKNVGKLGDWTLRYRTPGRIVQFDVPFELKDLPLP
jgi:hypothetical protein